MNIFPLRSSLATLLSLYNKVGATEEKESVFHHFKQEVKEFAVNLKHHSVREEDYLFRMMEKYLGKSGGPIAVMEYEHERADECINEFLKNTEENGQQTTDSIMSNAALVKNAHDILTGK